ncbi:hypothetical protein DWY47_17965 [Ruminococcus sp. AF25-23LB]|jgi:hypothetical protein|nr:hypothetical protein DWY47_17965 [Ruminococcus sp. AF25-23LB]
MYSGIRSSRNGYASIVYPMTDKKHQKGVRIGAFRCGNGIIDTGDAKGIRKQFARVWKKGNRDVGDIQAYTLLFSFSENELNPESMGSLDVAADIVANVIEKNYPGHQYTIVTQNDGKSGLVHCHACINALNRKTLKACRGRQTSYSVIREEIEKEMEIWNIPVDYGKQHIKSEKKQNQQTAKRKVNSEVSWMDELRKRIQIAVQQTVSLADLEENLNRYGVAVIKKTKSNWTFQLWDGTEFQGKKARGDKISPDFIPSKLRKTIDLNYQNSPQARHKRRAQETEKICNRITGANTTKESYLHY